MYRRPRGTADVLPQDQTCWRYVEARATALAHRYGYRRIDTPVFEQAELFVRGIGEATDIVQKEMYTFQDRGGEFVTLRAEGTAPVCRAYLEHGMRNLPQPVRLYYLCPVFRYERPQSGRYREHHQFGIEAIGEADPAVDAEVISVGWQLMAELGLRNLALVVNSIGDPVCRPTYLEALRAFYGPHLDEVCRDCRDRHQRNPLRLLDCKEESCQPFIQGAPRSTDHLCEACGLQWERLQRYLNVLGIPYRVDHRLVRGLDYYTRTVFEIQPPEEGAQSTILGGGRYDGLIQELGGKPTPGVGFAAGIERMVLNLQRQGVPVPSQVPSPVVIAYRGQAAQEEAMRWASRLWAEGVAAFLAPPGKSLKAQMRHASAVEAPFAIILGDDELRQGTAVLRDMARGQQESLSPDQLLRRLRDSP